jgi:hypothetical protein
MVFRDLNLRGQTDGFEVELAPGEAVFEGQFAHALRMTFVMV